MRRVVGRLKDVSMTESINVITLCGSLRKGSYNAALARMAVKLAPDGMKIAASPPIGDIPLYNFDVQTETGVPAAVTDLAAAIRSADGVLICSPEYNWSIPGVLKNAIDWMSRLKDQPIAGKPIAIQSASGGLLGASRMQYHLRQVLTSIDGVLFGKPEVFVTFASQKFDAQTLELTDQPTIDMIKQQLAGFEKFIRKHTGK
jgi:chromate reductase